MKQLKTIVCILWALHLLGSALPIKASSVNGGRFLFDSDSLLDIQIIASINELKKDRLEDQVSHPGKLIYHGLDNKPVEVSVSIKTRGNFRLNPRICNFPPLMLRFKKDAAANTIFSDIKKLKLVTHCQSKKGIYEKYTLREYLVYKLFSIFTPRSFRVRLARISYVDTQNKNRVLKKYGFFIEPVEMMAKRNDLRHVEIGNRTGYRLDSDQNTFLSVFQFMIGNTDWSFTADHNVKRFYPPTGSMIGAPYDFDFSGIVDTHYGIPIKRAKTTSTRDRFFQGFCQPKEVFAKIFTRFEKHKDEIFALYQNFPYITKGYKKNTIKYLEKFYKIIRTPRLVQKFIYENCIQQPGNPIEY